MGNFVKILARVGVPFFFMISGYYSVWSSGNNSKDKIIHILRLAVFMELVYICASSYTNTLVDLLRAYLFPTWGELILGIYRKCGVGWFVYALLCTYIIFVFMRKFQIYKLLYIWAIIGLVVHICTIFL